MVLATLGSRNCDHSRPAYPVMYAPAVPAENQRMIDCRYQCYEGHQHDHIERREEQSADEHPPTQTRFLECCDWRLKPAIAIFQVRKGEWIRCTLSGSFYRIALGFDLAGQDMLALTPAADRATRLTRVWAIGDGAAMAATRKIRSS